MNFNDKAVLYVLSIAVCLRRLGCIVKAKEQRLEICHWTCMDCCKHPSTTVAGALRNSVRGNLTLWVGVSIRRQNNGL
jgi:hypothetical protein